MSIETKRIWPEILVSGFLHLVWLTLLTFLLFGVEADTLKTFFGGLSAGASTILVTLALGGSFLLGKLADRLLTDLAGLVTEPPDESELLDALQKNQVAIEALECPFTIQNPQKAIDLRIDTFHPLVKMTATAVSVITNEHPNKSTLSNL